MKKLLKEEPFAMRLFEVFTLSELSNVAKQCVMDTQSVNEIKHWVKENTELPVDLQVYFDANGCFVYAVVQDRSNGIQYTHYSQTNLFENTQQQTKRGD